MLDCKLYRKGMEALLSKWGNKPYMLLSNDSNWKISAVPDANASESWCIKEYHGAKPQ